MCICERKKYRFFGEKINLTNFEMFMKMIKNFVLNMIIPKLEGNILSYILIRTGVLRPSTESDGQIYVGRKKNTFRKIQGSIENVIGEKYLMSVSVLHVAFISPAYSKDI